MHGVKRSQWKQAWRQFKAAAGNGRYSQQVHLAESVEFGSGETATQGVASKQPASTGAHMNRKAARRASMRHWGQDRVGASET